MSRESYHNAKKALFQLQGELERPPERKVINKLVHSLVKDHDLRDDPRRHHFELFATCALMGLESMCNNYKSKRRIK